MERLTEREPYWLGEEFWTSAKEPDDEEIDKVYERLMYYEDLADQGRLLELNEELALAMCAGARAIEQHHAHGKYCHNVFCPDDLKAIPYVKAATMLREEAEKALEGKAE